MTSGDGMAWLGFWLFLAAFIACDCWIFQQGYDSFFQRHKTPEEKQIQQLKIQKLKDELDKPS